MPKKKGRQLNHDLFFKDNMGNLQLAKDILEKTLAPDLLKRIDLDSLALWPTEYRQAYSNKQIIADRVYSVKTRFCPVHLVLLHVEAQSSPDRLMPLRLSETDDAIKRQYQENHKKNDPYLPLIMPIIFYTGTRSYTYSTSLRHLMHPEFRSYCRKSLIDSAPVIQVKHITPDDLLTYKRGALLCYGFQHQYDTDWIQAVEGLILLVHDLSSRYGYGPDDPTLLRAFQSVLLYLANYNTQNVSLDVLQRKLEAMRESLPNPLGETMMSVRDMFIHYGDQQGMQRGLQQGIQQGMQQGMQQGVQQGMQQGTQQSLQKVALNMLKKGFSDTEIAECTGLSIHELEQFKSDVIMP